ncbi:MAG: two-component sensor histidine kinase [Erythrobacteraceae bacterium]|nr:two-component sensor histidine kinase [Erythrobacteraceae bacterium]
MKRLLPQSLLGQVLASVALVLLFAQVVSVTLLYRAGEERRENAAITAAAYRLINGGERAERAERRAAWRAEREEREGGDRREGRRGRRDDRGGQGRGGPGGGDPVMNLPRQLRYTVSAEPPMAVLPTEGEHEERLRAILAQEGVVPHAAVITAVRAGDDPALAAFVASRPRFRNNTEWRDRQMFVAAIQRSEGGEWETVRSIEPPRPRDALRGIVFQTLITFALLMIVLFFVLRRITRPLAQLTERVSTFSRNPDQTMKLAETGPADMRHLIAAYNTMETRIAALLDEKDVMLGAIGHDLKTPLAALRVRIESVPDDAQRDKMAHSIEDITATLDDILALARVGRSGGLEIETVDLGMLAIGVTEEFEDLGESVTIGNPPRVVARVQVTWIKRALRNLVSNALRYGEAADLSVEITGNTAVLRVEDRGPGIPEDRIAEMLEPFTRGEASRNRATGGAGLGLTLARAIAEQHGGELVLTNREKGGLRAEIRLPL